MSVTKNLIEQELHLLQSGRFQEVHLHREGSFLRAYDWSAWLCCRFLHDFKVNKRKFKDVDNPVAYIGFPDTSLGKWMPEGAVQRVESEKHLVVELPELMFTDSAEAMSAAYAEWKEGIPLTESNPGLRKRGGKGTVVDDDIDESTVTLTAIMQRVLAFPIESKSPIESMTFLADIKRQLASLI
ncbi:MAG: hypothetical protein IJK46_08885 [Prevotella sp.]|nr:hypothetical protein [Prevotella sp.]